MAKSIVFGTKIILQVSSINIYTAGVAMRMLVLTLLTFKKVKLSFGHPVLWTILLLAMVGLWKYGHF